MRVRLVVIDSSLSLLEHQPLPALTILDPPECFARNRILGQVIQASLLFFLTLMLMELAPFLLHLRSLSPRQHCYQLEQEGLRKLAA